MHSLLRILNNDKYHRYKISLDESGIDIYLSYDPKDEYDYKKTHIKFSVVQGITLFADHTMNECEYNHVNKLITYILNNRDYYVHLSTKASLVDRDYENEITGS